MHKKSHIIDSHVYAIPISQLINFGTPFQHRLTEKSYRSLISVFPSITPPEWIETAKLPGAKSSRSSPSPTPVPVKVPAPTSAAVPAEIRETIAALLKYLSKEQLLQAVPDMIHEYPQLFECLA